MSPPLPTIAVAVPCLDEEAALPGLASSIRALDPPPEAILIVDDGSRDGTAGAARGAGLRVLSHPRNRGLAAARNTAWRAADTDVVAYLDADVRPPPDWIGRIRAGLADPDVAGLGGWNREGPPRSAADRFRARHWPQWGGPTATGAAPWLVGACAAYRRSALEAVSGFDERFRSHGEDVEIGLRLNARGFRLAYDPDLTVSHARHDGPGSLARMCYLHCLWGGRASRLHGSPVLPLALGVLRKGARAPAGLLLRHLDPAAAAVASLGCASGLVGYAVAALARFPPPDDGVS
ncbi:glycosyltransferase [Myxococcota bacterium]|nr:glycosyltransferase [Myxococcota bacterium]